MSHVPRVSYGSSISTRLAQAGVTTQTSLTNDDAQIAAIVVTANQVDVDAGKLAQQRASSSAVKKFTALMVSDHEGVNKQAVALATRLKVTPQENDTSRALKAGGDKNVAHLKTLSGQPSTRLTWTTRSSTTRRYSTRSTNPDSWGVERRPEGAARQGTPRVCRPSRARKATPGLARCQREDRP
jgi:hypothetical protein